MKPKEQVRRAYERGRFRRALWFGLLAVPLVIVSEAACGTPLFSCCTGLVLALLLIGYAHRGQELEASIGPGMGAGLTAFTVPLLAVPFGLCSRAEPWACAAVCAVGGVIAGAVVAHQMRKKERPTQKFVIAGALLAMTAGAMGCVLAGFAGVAGMVAGTAAVSMPVLLWQRSQPEA